MTDTTRPKRYRMVSKYYKETYGEKVYKLPVAFPLTCPNRDGSAGVGGCTADMSKSRWFGRRRGLHLLW